MRHRRYHNKGIRDYRYYSSQFDIHTRIDFILISEDMDKALFSNIGNKIWSNHALIETDIKLKETILREPHWILHRAYQ